MENLNNFRLLTPSGAKIEAISYTSNNVRFSNMDLKDIISKDTTAAFNILADINSNTN
ncbi:MAG: hypothetical protein LBU14_00320 [Candidatus Peribacteria bacterium]|nr:hypothetical protein [Candidatus Peribacteria bacterium]